MQGLANLGLRCNACGNLHADTSGLCLYCRGRAHGLACRRYHFTDELLADLQSAYCGNRTDLSAALDRLMARTGWPRHAFLSEAQRQGWTRDGRKPWAKAETAYLEAHLGTVSVRRIARALGRSVASVQAKAEDLQLSCRVTEGYTREDLSKVFREHPHKIRRWIERGMFGRLRDGRVTERGVRNFIRNYPAEYSLKRVDELWYKGMLFGARLAGRKAVA